MVLFFLEYTEFIHFPGNAQALKRLQFHRPAYKLAVIKAEVLSDTLAGELPTDPAVFQGC